MAHRSRCARGHSPPEVLHSADEADERQVFLPGSAFIVLEEPQPPPAGQVINDEFGSNNQTQAAGELHTWSAEGV